jgi:hypothetical protein
MSPPLETEDYIPVEDERSYGVADLTQASIYT